MRERILRILEDKINSSLKAITELKKEYQQVGSTSYGNQPLVLVPRTKPEILRDILQNEIAITTWRLTRDRIENSVQWDQT